MSGAQSPTHTQQEGDPSSTSSNHGLSHKASMDSTATDNSTALPPFPPAGASPDTRSPPPAHPHAEYLLNAAAQHVFPEHPAPQRSPADESKGVTKEGRISPGDRDGSKRAKEGKQREEEPLLMGTPLDEMTPLKTPGILSGGQPGFPFPPKRTHSSSTITPANREGSGDTLGATQRSGTIGAIPENEQLKTDIPTEMGKEGQPGSAVSARRPDLRAHDYGSVRMGASALMSALNALPWDDDAEGSSSDSDDETNRPSQVPPPKASASQGQRVGRPKATRMTSSLHAIPTATPAATPAVPTGPSFAAGLPDEQHPSATKTSHAHAHRHGHDKPQRPAHSLQFPFRANTIARRARGPGESELSYQMAMNDPAGMGQVGHQSPQEAAAAASVINNLERMEGRRRSSADSATTQVSRNSLDPEMAEMLNERIAAEENAAKAEEGAEIARVASGDDMEERARMEAQFQSMGMSDASASAQGQQDGSDPTAANKSQIDREQAQQKVNTAAALQEAEHGQQVEVEDRMQQNQGERQRLRREQLSQRLQEVFGLDEKEEVLEETRCWLLRSVMLKGYMYITPKHICFFAHMPDGDTTVVKTGPLSKRASRTKLSTKWWAVLKKDVLSWYEAASDPYFPKGNISLQYATSCDPLDGSKFKIRTAERNYTFTADTEAARDEWVKAIQKVMFKTQHEGDCVKLIIPLEVVLEIDQTPTLEFAETIEIRCVDPDDQMSVDSYFFASFHDTGHVMRIIQALLDQRPDHQLPRVQSDYSEYDGEGDGDFDEQDRGSSEQGGGSGERKQSIKKKLGSVLKPLVGKMKKDDGASEKGEEEGSFTDIGPTRSRDTQGHSDASTGEVGDGYPPRQHGRPPHGQGSDDKTWSNWLTKPVSTVSKALAPSASSKTSLLTRVSSSRSSLPQPTTPPSGHARLLPRRSRGRKGSEVVTETVEPTVRDPDADDDLSDSGNESHSDFEMGTGSAYGSSDEEGHEGGNEDEAQAHIAHNRRLRKQASRESNLAPGQSQRRRQKRGSRSSRLSFGSISGAPGEKGSASLTKGFGRGKREEAGYSMLDASEQGKKEDVETERKFRAVFALPETEELLDHFPGYLYRVLPVSGRFFVSNNYFCFRSSQLLYKTKMIIPIRDLFGMKAQKAFRFGHSGLIVVVKGHEELFLEFSSSRRRQACVAILEERMEDVRVRLGIDPSAESAAGEKDRISARIMEDLDESRPVDDTLRSPPPVSPPIFDSTASTFLEFKPETPMTVTCLTIGSRGDVQPYIALCKGLQAEGHTTRIASHGEYKDWVEGHGIEFASIGGDPAELMQMCVDNGMFTVSFLKEGLQKFRGWLDDLLESSWEACQGSDLLIESPSAMGGMHIAEALRIPYFRAFTMPWTRTRAYPHAFAVPEHKRGGSYNYMTYTMFDQVFWRAISGQVNRWRRKTLGIEATDFDKLAQHKVPFLYNFSPSVVPPPLDWTEWIHITGYWFLENADESAAKEKKSWSPPEGLLEFIDGAKKKGKKVVYIGFGSIVVSDPEEMTRCVVEAVVDAGVCAILSKGWSDRGSKKEDEDEDGAKDGADGVKYPDEIFPIDSIDHSWLFTRIDAACHHGGAGTTGASLRAGIPTIIKPFFGDQAFWSERVESLNVGSAVRKLTKEALSEALKKATTDEKQIAKAKIVGETIRKENGVMRAIESIYRDLEYAKSLIKPPPSPSGGGGILSLSPTSSIGKVTSHISMPSFSSVNLTRTLSPKDKSENAISDDAAAGESNIVRSPSNADADDGGHAEDGTKRKSRPSSFSSLGNRLDKIDKSMILGPFAKDKDKGRRRSSDVNASGSAIEEEHEHEQQYELGREYHPTQDKQGNSETPSTGHSQQGHGGATESESSWSVVSDAEEGEGREGVRA